MAAEDPRTMTLVAWNRIQHGPSFIVETLVFETEDQECYAYASASMDWVQLMDDADIDPRPELIDDPDIVQYLDKLSSEKNGEA